MCLQKVPTPTNAEICGEVLAGETINIKGLLTMRFGSNRSFDSRACFSVWSGAWAHPASLLSGLASRGAAASLAFALSLSALQAMAEEKPIGSLGSIIGKAQVLRGDKTLPATKGMKVFPSDSLVTSDKTAVKIQFDDGGTFMAFENAKVKIEEYKFQAGGEGAGTLKSAFEIAKGKVRFFVKPQPKGKVDTKYKTANAVMGIRGTSGFIDASKPGQTQLVVLTGKVEVSNPANPSQKVLVPPNQMTEVTGSAGVPTPPKPAPAALMSSLNSEANKVDPKGNGGESQPQKSDDKKSEEKKDDKKDDKKSDDKKSDDKKSDDKKSDDNKKPEEGKKPDDKKSDDSKSGPSDSKKSDDGKGAPADSKKPDDNKGGPASTQGANDSGSAKPAPGGANGGSETAASGKESAPVQVERKAVYSPDGSSTISVKDDKLNNLTTPTINTRSPVSDVASKALAAPQQAVQQVQTTVTDNTQKAVQNQVDKAAKAAAAEDPNKKKSVKVKIVLPNNP